MTHHNPSPDAPEASAKAVSADSDHEPGWVRFLERGETIMLLGGLGSLVFSFLALGVIPLIDLRDEVTASTPASYDAMTAEEEHGFTVYKQEGCAYCHTTFVRDTPSDVQRFGPPAEAWEYQDQYPQQWGTRRIGPDLSRESGKRSDGWQYAHLYNPRSTVPQSVMPSYPWLFSEAPDGSVVPNEEAAALVAYLNYLGRDIAESGPQTERGKNAMHGSAGSGHGGM
jgi:cbb3-type cytochrome c oxidase subunit II